MYDYKSPLDTMYQPRPKPQTGKATAIKVATAFGAVALVGIAGISVASHCGQSKRILLLFRLEPVLTVTQAMLFVTRRWPPLPLSSLLSSVSSSLPFCAVRTRTSPSPVCSPMTTLLPSTPLSLLLLAMLLPVLPVMMLPRGLTLPLASASPSCKSDLTTKALLFDNNTNSFPLPPLSRTPTSLNTVYTIRTPDANTTTVVIIPSATHTCTSQEPDETSTVMVTVTVVPEQTQQPPPAYGSSSLPSGVTVTGNPATVTDVQTDTHYTSGAPDATVSGTPATVTDVQTDTRFTSGAPDATVSGEPATVTSVITNTAGEPMTTLTFTSTLRITVTTVTRSRSSSSVDVDSSVLGLPHTTTGYPSNPAVTHTTTVTVTDGAPVTSTTTVELPEPYGGEYPTPWGTGLPINATASPTYVPPVVSAGSEACGCSMVYLAIAAVASLCLV